MKIHAQRCTKGKALISRAKLEEFERQTLAPYAIKSADTLGRQHPEDERPARTAFQRDRERILHTTAFRRLEYKTQVFVNYEGDYYRTRLTHTLEVAQVGRALARALGLNEDLVEGICLAHDLGHTPFGHAGEYALDELMSDDGGFEHNKQSLRIVTKLEKRYADWDGLNLTYEMREGIVKHESEYDTSATSDDYHPEWHASLEAQVANLADELAYNAHDLDDGLRAGILHPDQLTELEFVQQVLGELDIAASTLSELDRHRLVRRIISLQIADVIAESTRAIEAANVQSVEDVQRLDHNLIRHSDGFRQMNRQHKDFLYANFYHHYRVVRMARKARRFLMDLFEAYDDQPAMLPPKVRALFDERGKRRAITDYIAGMTDRYALQEWERLFTPFARP
jgi:dGTPase